jgi:hypothetical protein
MIFDICKRQKRLFRKFQGQSVVYCRCTEEQWRLLTLNEVTGSKLSIFNYWSMVYKILSSTNRWMCYFSFVSLVHCSSVCQVFHKAFKPNDSTLSSMNQYYTTIRTCEYGEWCIVQVLNLCLFAATSTGQKDGLFNSQLGACHNHNMRLIVHVCCESSGWLKYDFSYSCQ